MRGKRGMWSQFSFVCRCIFHLSHGGREKEGWGGSFWNNAKDKLTRQGQCVSWIPGNVPKRSVSAASDRWGINSTRESISHFNIVLGNVARLELKSQGANTPLPPDQCWAFTLGNSHSWLHGQVFQQKMGNAALCSAFHHPARLTYEGHVWRTERFKARRLNVFSCSAQKTENPNTQKNFSKCFIKKDSVGFFLLSPWSPKVCCCFLFVYPFCFISMCFCFC